MSISKQDQQWRVAPEDRTKTQALARLLGVPRLTAHLMMLRGIDSLEEGHRFLNPSLEQLGDPMLLPDLPAAIDRLREAGRRNERIRVFGDYDVDGIAGTAILLGAFERMGLANCDFAMPDRVSEGYGITPDHVEAAHRDGVQLIITVDNGITAREAAETARRRGIAFIVTDHHHVEGPLPHAAAVVNPKRPGHAYPSSDASGAAVAYHVARALTGEHDADIDLVALGTVADIVPLRGENRVLTAAGLRRMARTPRVGLYALAEAAGVNIRQVNSENIAFHLGPRLNAAGRLGDGILPLELLLTHDGDAAARMAAELNAANEKRRAIEKAIFDDAVEQMEKGAGAGEHSIVLASRAWHAGVIGIVASRLVNLYNRPVVLMAVGEDGIGRGSARSTEDFDMADALAACSECLLRFGGHAAAAGLAILEDRVSRFQTRFEQEARRRLRETVKAPELTIDGQVSLTEIDPALVRTLEQLEPYGCLNPAPVLCAYGVNIVPNSARELQGGHLKLSVKQGGRILPGIGFRMAPVMQRMPGVPAVDIAFTPKFNTWRGDTLIQLVIKDIRPAQ